MANLFASALLCSCSLMSFSNLFCLTFFGTSLALYSTLNARSSSLRFSLTICSTLRCLIEKPFSAFKNSNGTGTVTLYFPLPVFGTQFYLSTNFLRSSLMSLYCFDSKSSSCSCPLICDISSSPPIFPTFLLSWRLSFSDSLNRPLFVKKPRKVDHSMVGCL